MPLQRRYYSQTKNCSVNSMMAHITPNGKFALENGWSIYWAKVLTDHPKNCDNVFVIQYFGMNFGTFNENTIWHQSCASAGIWHSACSLRMRKHTKPSKCTCNSRNDLNRNSNHRNLKNNVFCVKMTLNWLTTVKTYGGKRSSKWRMTIFQTQIVTQR